MNRTRFAIIAALALTLGAQEPLNNDGVIKLIKAGMTEELVMNVIRNSPGAYTLGAAELIALKEAGVSERVITVMLERSGRGASNTAAPAGRSIASAVSAPADGLYYKKNNEYLELLAEDVEWRTGGALKSIASAGFIKKDLKGSISGPSSRNFLQSSTEIVIAPPQGFSINDYILLPLRPEKGVRNFDVGPVNQKSGVAKGAIAFGVEKAGASQFRLVLQTPLSTGEYGILTTKNSSGQPGAGPSRMFTFRILP